MKGAAMKWLYEWDTVARRFGGRFARKVPAALNSIHDVYLKRSEEMGIKVRYCAGEGCPGKPVPEDARTKAEEC